MFRSIYLSVYLSIDTFYVYVHIYIYLYTQEIYPVSDPQIAQALRAGCAAISGIGAIRAIGICQEFHPGFQASSLGFQNETHQKASGKPTKNDGKSSFYPFLIFWIGKSTISMAIFNSYVNAYQRVETLV